MGTGDPARDRKPSALLAREKIGATAKLERRQRGVTLLHENAHDTATVYVKSHDWAVYSIAGQRSTSMAGAYEAVEAL